jgi:hypothetical protein
VVCPRPSLKSSTISASSLTTSPALIWVGSMVADHPVEWERANIRDWARQLKVSQQALALRLQEAGLAPDDFYARFVAGQRHVERAC